MKQSVYELHGLLSKTKIVEVEVEVPGESEPTYLEMPWYWETFPAEPVVNEWERPEGWLPRPANQYGFLGLLAVSPEAPYAAIKAADAYIVDWGDGTVTSHAADTVAEHEYNFDPDSYFDDKPMLDSHQWQAWVSVTPDTSVGASITKVDLQVRHSAYPALVSTGWQEIVVIGSSIQQLFVCSSANTSYTRVVNHAVLENIYIDCGVLNAGFMFHKLKSLRNIELFSLPDCTTASRTFEECISLETIKSFSVALPECTYLFQCFMACRGLRSVHQLVIPKAQDMRGMFKNCTVLTYSAFGDALEATTVASMFEGCYALTGIYLPSFPKVTSMHSMFLNCLCLEYIFIGECPLLANTTEAFKGCSVLRYVRFHGLLPALRTAYGMFQDCSNLQYFPNMDTSNIQTFSQMFMNCKSLEHQAELDNGEVTPLSFNNAITITSLFQGCSSLRKVVEMRFVSPVNAGNAFMDCINLVDFPDINYDMLSSTSGMFKGCASLTEIGNLTLTRSTNISAMFENCISIKSIGNIVAPVCINSFSAFMNVAALESIGDVYLPETTNTTALFSSSRSLVSTGVITLTKATNLSNLFINCFSLRDIGDIIAPAVTSFNSAFFDCRSLVQAPSLDFTNVTDLRGMFSGCSSLTSAGLDAINWNTTKCAFYSTLFKDCSRLVTIPYFDTSIATDFVEFARNCEALIEMPAYNLGAMTSNTAQANMVTGCSNLRSFKCTNIKATFSVANCMLSAGELNRIYENLRSDRIAGATVTVTGNYGAVSDDITIATAKGWTVTE